MVRFLILIAFSLVHFASAVYSMTMEEAVKLALTQNIELRLLRLEEEVAKAQVQKARLPLIANPNVEGNVETKGKGGDVQRTFRDYGLSLSQEFEIAGQRGFRIDVAEKELQRICFEVRDKERIIVSDVKNAFARDLASKRRVELRKEAVGLKEELLEFSRIKFKAGDVSGLEVNVAELEVGKARTEFLAADREYKESILNLQDITGAKPDVNFRIEGEILTDILGVPDKENLKKSALANRPDLKASLIEVEKARSAIYLARREAIPNITVSVSYQRGKSVV